MFQTPAQKARTIALAYLVLGIFVYMILPFGAGKGNFPYFYFIPGVAIATGFQAMFIAVAFYFPSLHDISYVIVESRNLTTALTFLGFLLNTFIVLYIVKKFLNATSLRTKILIVGLSPIIAIIVYVIALILPFMFLPQID